MISPSSSNKSKEIAPYMCSYCARKFFRIASYKIHENKCKVLYETSKMTLHKPKTSKENTRDSKKITKLENKVDELKLMLKQLISQKERKRINISDYLNETYSKEMSLSLFLEKINIDVSTFETIFLKKNFVDGCIDILNIESTNDSMPIKAYEQKKNVLYIKCDNVWQLMSSEMLSYVVNKLNNKINQAYTCWDNENMNKSDSSDKFLVLSKNIHMGNKTHLEICNKILRKLYQSIKNNIRNYTADEILF